MADSNQAPTGLARTFFSEAGLMSAFAMRAVRVAFQPPFELREVIHQVYMMWARYAMARPLAAPPVVYASAGISKVVTRLDSTR